MLEKLISLSLRERFIVYFSTILIAVAGVYSFTQLPIEAYPDLTNTSVQVISQWPGRGAEELEKFITVPIETEMNGIGGILGLLLTGQHFLVSAGVGFIALFGVSVQDGVVLLSSVKKHKARFPDLDELLKFAGGQRVRPIIMVALLAMIGLMPAALSTGIGSETQKPLATVIVSGLFLTALTNLILLPLMYKLLKPKV
jgi:Cu/Ag efflux pump CusA